MTVAKGLWFEYLVVSPGAPDHNTYKKIKVNDDFHLDEDELDQIYFDDQFLLANGFRRFDGGRRFHGHDVFLIKKDDAYQLVGYERCIVRTVDELQLLIRVITGKEFEPTFQCFSK